MTGQQIEVGKWQKVSLAKEYGIAIRFMPASVQPETRGWS
jgi:hypothetical protein